MLFVTAFLECFIRLDYRPAGFGGNALAVAKADFLDSVRFIGKERRDILRILLLAALSRFFVMGVTLVGLPFLVRTVLGLDARYYGAAESVLAVAVIAGSMAAGVLAGKIQKGGLSAMLAAVGLCIVPAGLAFLLPAGTGVRVCGSCGCFLRDADSDQHVFHLCGVDDPAGYAGVYDWQGDGLHVRHYHVRPAGGADGVWLFV